MLGPDGGESWPMEKAGHMVESNSIVLEAAVARFREQKAMAERAVAQLSFEQLKEPLDANTNSIAVIMKHMAGNMRSRWTDFLTTDGEKPWRKRDGEFVDTFDKREALSEYWEGGWACLFGAVESLSAGDLDKTVNIRGKPHTVIEAIIRQLDHYGYHVGQIVLTARMLAKGSWETLTVPRGESKSYNDCIGYE